MSEGKVNQRLIARQLKISLTTVSRSLANHPAISADMRAKVRRAANELGYRTGPRPISRRRSLRVGVLIGAAKTEILCSFPLILKGIQDKAQAERVSVEPVYLDPAAFDPEASRNPVFRHIRNGDWRGVVLVYPFAYRAVEVISRKISTVSALENYAGLPVDSIDTEDTAGIGQLVARLARLGHRRIGFVAWRYTIAAPWCLRRFGAYAAGLFEHGLEFRQEWTFNVHQGSPRVEPLQLAAEIERRLRDDRVTAWVCAADHEAYPLIGELRHRGLRVPEDCSITGFDGIEPPQGLPPLTTVRIPHEDLGASALARVLNRIAHPHAPFRKILVEGDSVEGASVAPLGSA